MGLRQSFRFQFQTENDVRTFLRSFSQRVVITESPDFFVFSQLPGQPEFTFDCELVPDGINSDRAGKYFPFLGEFVEAITGRFGQVEIEDL